MLLRLFKALNERVIAFHPVYAKLAGGVGPGIFLQQAVYWSLKTDDGWFYKETKDFEKETTLSRHEQDTARRNLTELGVLEERRSGDHAVLNYRINFEVLERAIAENRQWRNPAVAIAEKRQSVGSVSINSESTSEIIRESAKSETLEDQTPCSKCGTVGRHSCGGWKSEKTQKREARRLQRRIQATPEFERAPRYVPTPRSIEPTLDDDYPLLRPPK